MNRNTGASRRAVVRGFAGTVGVAVLAPVAAMAQQPTAATGAPPTVISNPPRQWGHHAPPNIYPDPDVIVIDPAFAALRVGNNAIHRIATGFTWAEGPAWSSEGQYFVFSDVVGNTQYRVLWDDRRMTPFRRPSNNSNGNSFDFQGRQLSTGRAGYRYKKAAQTGRPFYCVSMEAIASRRAVSFASPTALWAAPFANLLCLLAVAILRWACPGGWWNSALAAAQHVADEPMTMPAVMKIPIEAVSREGGSCAFCVA